MMNHNWVVPLVVFAVPLYLYSYNFIAANSSKEELKDVYTAIFIFSCILSVGIKLLSLEEAPSFFETIGGVIISFCLVFIVLTFFLFLFVVYIRVMDKALSP